MLRELIQAQISFSPLGSRLRIFLSFLQLAKQLALSSHYFLTHVSYKISARSWQTSCTLEEAICEDLMRGKFGKKREEILLEGSRT